MSSFKDAVTNGMTEYLEELKQKLEGLTEATLMDVFSEVPSSELPKSELSADRLLIDVLGQCEIVKSKGEAKRLIKNGGLYLNNVRVETDRVAVEPTFEFVRT